VDWTSLGTAEIVYFLEHFSFSWDGVIQHFFFLVLSLGQLRKAVGVCRFSPFPTSLLHRSKSFFLLSIDISQCR
ncbi:hypothetical protein P7M41_26240, partial [Vibrio parahaemolyticus]|nr:hypothetical protein [Vibrio parahaemolyticus]